MSTSIYRQYFVAVDGKSDKVKCTVGECKEEVSSKKASNLQFHLQKHHGEFYAAIQASPKAMSSKDQPSGFFIGTPSKRSGSMRELQMLYATSTAPIDILKNPYFKVSFLKLEFNFTIILEAY